VGHVTEPPDSQRNFLIVDQKTETSQIEKAFTRFTKERKDIGILLINQHVRNPETTEVKAVVSIFTSRLSSLCSALNRAIKDIAS
jgi:V-type H+-transporting ATPase subunit F